MCYVRWIPCRPPVAHPQGCKTYLDFINWKRIEAPKPFMKDGFFDAPLLWLMTRKIRCGLVPIPKPFVLDPAAVTQLMDSYKGLVKSHATAFS